MNYGEHVLSAKIGYKDKHQRLTILMVLANGLAIFTEIVVSTFVRSIFVIPAFVASLPLSVLFGIILAFAKILVTSALEILCHWKISSF